MADDHNDNTGQQTVTAAEQQLPARYLLSLLRHMRDSAVDTSPIIESLDLDLEKLASEPGLFVTSTTYNRLYQHYVDSMGSANFGFPGQMGENLGRYRMLLLLMVNCPTLGDALDRIEEFTEAFSINERMLWREPGNDDIATINMDFQIRGDIRKARQEATVIGNLMYSMYALTCWLTGTEQQLSRVNLDCSPPSQPDKYRRLFGVSVAFEQAQNQLAFSSDIMHCSIVRTESDVEVLLNNWPMGLFMRPDHATTSRTVTVEQLVERMLDKRPPELHQVALSLGTQASTLQRELAQENTSFTQIVEQQKKRKALELLKSERSITDIARQLGFSASSAFHRSFKRWTGTTPGEYRRNVTD
jgi:AraC-like DNA-binding protein